MRVVKIHKEINSFDVHNDNGQEMTVTASQLMIALLNGHVVDNVILTKKGFGVNTGKNGVRYTQMSLGPDAKKLLAKRLAEQEKRLRKEKQVRHSITQIVERPAPAIKSLNLDAPKGIAPTNKQRPLAKPKINVGTEAKKQEDANHKQQFVYKGTVYLSVDSLLKSTNSDVDSSTFIERYKKGYSMDECLGFIECRPENKITPRERRDKTLDALDKERMRRAKKEEQGKV